MLINKNKVKLKLIDYIYRDTGINLDPGDVMIKKQGKLLDVKVYGVPFGNSDLYTRDLKGCSAEDTAILILERVGDIKQAIINQKIQQLRQFLPGLEQEVKTRLSLRMNQQLLDSLSFVIEDRGYDYSHNKTDQEAESGFPLILLHIFNTNGLRIDYPLNIYYPAAMIDDMKLLISNILTGCNIKN